MAASVYTFCIVHTYHHWVFWVFFSIFNSAWQADPPQNHNYSTEPSQAPAAQCSATGYISVCLMLCKHSRHPDISADNKLAQWKTLSSIFLKAFPDSLTHSRWWPCFPLALCLNCSQNHSDKPRRQPNLRCLQTTLTPCGKALQLTQAPFFFFFVQPGSYSIQMSNHLPPLMGSLIYEFSLFPYIVQ